MKRAADFRKIARDALSGRWGIAIVAGLIAGLFGAVAVNIPSISLDVPSASDLETMETAFADDRFRTVFFSIFGIIMLILLAVVVVYSVIAGVIGVGYCRFNLDYVDRQTAPSIGTLFRFFKGWKTIAAAVWLQALYVFCGRCCL